MKVEDFVDAEGARLGVSFECPGCGMTHGLYVQDTPERITGPRWTFNGNYDRPTLSPSILARGALIPRQEPPGDWDGNAVCHSFVTDGRIQFLGDCTHALAGQTVELADIVS